MSTTYRLGLTVEAPSGVGIREVKAEVRSQGLEYSVALDAVPAVLGQSWSADLDLPHAPRLFNVRLLCDDGEVQRVCYQLFHLPDDLDAGTLAVQLVGREGGVWGVRVDDEGMPPLSLQFLWGFVILAVSGWLYACRIRHG